MRKSWEIKNEILTFLDENENELNIFRQQGKI